MSLAAIKGQRGEEQALCGCDMCAAEIVVAARHGNSTRFVAGGKPAMTIQSESSVVDHLRKQGWSQIKNKLRCPKCEAERVAKQQEAHMPTITAAPRQPTAAQEVDIIVALSSVYDRKAKRYTGQETDKTVAEAVGDGCMPGWVTNIRQEKFGPAGNEEAEAIRAEIAAFNSETRRLIQALSDDYQRKLAAITARLDALYKAEDKRVRT